MQTYLISETGRHHPVIVVDVFTMSGVQLAVVDASCGGLYPDRCTAITCAAGDLVRLSAEADDEALADVVMDLYDRTHHIPAAVLDEEPISVDWGNLQPAEMRALGINWE